MSQACKRVIPQLVLTTLAHPLDDDAHCVQLPNGTEYFVRPTRDIVPGTRPSGRHSLGDGRFNLFPIVLGPDGSPWAEAVVYLLARLETASSISMATYWAAAEDLAAFRRFLDETPSLDWVSFPIHKSQRPTYRYNGHLKIAVQAGEVSVTTARRRMSSVIAFYRWLAEEGVFKPENSPWTESDRFVYLEDSKGIKFSRKITCTDVSIKVSKQDDPYEGVIEDGGKLRPLTVGEQEWLLEALISVGNTEMTLIHLLGMVTGARIQSILTFRVCHVMRSPEDLQQVEHRIPIGPGTGIDTKRDKRLVLHVPFWLYQRLHVYAQSERARNRRARASGGNVPDQYLFLSRNGTPFYETKEKRSQFDENLKIRHVKAGQAVRMFMTERIIPYIREIYDPKFSYRFHDTRATFGMNMTDQQLSLVAAGHITLYEAREFVKVRMGHDSSAVTDRYLQFRNKINYVRNVQYCYGQHLQELMRASSGDIV
jgi:hypothetical protein